MVQHELKLGSGNLTLKLVSGNLKSKSANVGSNPKEGMPRLGSANVKLKSANEESNSNEGVEGRSKQNESVNPNESGGSNSITEYARSDGRWRFGNFATSQRRRARRACNSQEIGNFATNQRR
jgi:hypothetical protein